MNFKTFYLEKVRPYALKVANNTRELRKFIYQYVNMIDNALSEGNPRKACMTAMNWNEEINDLPIFNYFHCQWQSLDKLKELVNELIEMPF